MLGRSEDDVRRDPRGIMSIDAYNILKAMGDAKKDILSRSLSKRTAMAKIRNMNRLMLPMWCSMKALLARKRCTESL